MVLGQASLMNDSNLRPEQWPVDPGCLVYIGNGILPSFFGRSYRDLHGTHRY